MKIRPLTGAHDYEGAWYFCGRSRIAEPPCRPHIKWTAKWPLRQILRLHAYSLREPGQRSQLILLGIRQRSRREPLDELVPEKRALRCAPSRYGVS